jgi:hypothetical protein
LILKTRLLLGGERVKNNIEGFDKLRKNINKLKEEFEKPITIEIQNEENLDEAVKREFKKITDDILKKIKW